MENSVPGSLIPRTETGALGDNGELRPWVPVEMMENSVPGVRPWVPVLMEMIDRVLESLSLLIEPRADG